MKRSIPNEISLKFLSAFTATITLKGINNLVKKVKGKKKKRNRKQDLFLGCLGKRKKKNLFHYLGYAYKVKKSIK